MIKKVILYSLVLLLFLQLISYRDYRPMDGNIQLGFPLTFYLDGSLGKFCSNPNNVLLDICKYPKLNYPSLFIDLISIYMLSFILFYAILRYKKRKKGS